MPLIILSSLSLVLVLGFLIHTLSPVFWSKENRAIYKNLKTFNFKIDLFNEKSIKHRTDLLAMSECGKINISRFRNSRGGWTLSVKEADTNKLLARVESSFLFPSPVEVIFSQARNRKNKDKKEIKKNRTTKYTQNLLNLHKNPN